MEHSSRILDLISKLWQLAKKKWKALDISGKLYFWANALLPVMLLGMLSHSESASTTLLLFSVPVLTLASAGFVVWAISALRRNTLSRHFLKIMIGIQALLIPPCISLAQKVVSDATEFPGDAFELTTAFLTVLLIPVAWALILFAIAISAMTIGLVGSTLIQTISSLMLPFLILSTKATQCLMAAREKSSAVGQHLLGFAITTAFLVFGALGLLMSISQGSAVRLAVYALDFGTAAKYPGIDHSRPMKLLDNNLVVYATRTGLEIVFEVESVQPIKVENRVMTLNSSYGAY